MSYSAINQLIKISKLIEVFCLEGVDRNVRHIDQKYQQGLSVLRLCCQREPVKPSEVRMCEMWFRVMRRPGQCNQCAKGGIRDTSPAVMASGQEPTEAAQGLLSERRRNLRFYGEKEVNCVS